VHVDRASLVGLKSILTLAQRQKVGNVWRSARNQLLKRDIHVAFEGGAKFFDAASQGVP
jgi:hypothetical protein